MSTIKKVVVISLFLCYYLLGDFMKKIVFVSGGSRGLGAAISEEFAINNYDVIINYVNDDARAQATKKELEEKYKCNVYLYKCDISDEEKVAAMFADILKNVGNIDALVNNAGIALDSEMFSKTKESFIRTYETNLVGPFLCCKYAKDMINHDGSIINISSTNGIDTYYNYSADYDASKAALINLTYNLAAELAPIRVNAVAPGWINTEMNKELDSDYIKKEEEKIIMKRFAEPSEIAKVVYFLASSSASYVTGTVVRVDGGINA